MKNKNTLTVIFAIIAVIVLGFYVVVTRDGEATLVSENENVDGLVSDENTDILRDKKIVVYKSASCGCCAVYASYLKKEGLDVEIQNVENLDDVKRANKVPRELSSCHTSIIEGYVVEGHIPVEAIAKLLTDMPNISGIAMAGMPIGSPGMPGKKEFPFEIYKLGEDGLFMEI